MEFRIARAARVTGQMLEEGVRAALRTQGIREPDCVVCYGAGYIGPKRALNATCSTMNKMEQGVALSNALEDSALKIIPADSRVVRATRVFPIVARKIKHSKGRDMIVCRSTKAAHRVLLRRDYFTPLVDSDTEYRAWVYRKRILCVYEKRLTEPLKNTKFGRNRANGWTFHALDTEQIPDSVRRVAVAAVRALNLDFGAVDILGKRRGTEIIPTVLEVNSAPGVANEHRSGIVKLVNRIVRWCANGCPPREA